MASKIAHRSAAEIPPAIPFRAGEIHFVKRTFRRWAEPPLPVQAGGNRTGSGRALEHMHDVLVTFRRVRRLPTPRAADPHVGFSPPADRARLNQFHNAAVI